MQCNGAAGVLSNIIRVFKLAMFISWCTIAYRSFKWCYVHCAKENTIFWPSAEITPKCGWIHPVFDFPSPLKKSFDIQWNICGFYLITYYRIILWKRNFWKKIAYASKRTKQRFVPFCPVFGILIFLVISMKHDNISVQIHIAYLAKRHTLKINKKFSW